MAEALRRIMSRPICADPATTLHFVDDRLDTLLAARASPNLTARPWKLYLASWGYCTAEEVAEARRHEGIQVRAPHLGGRGGSPAPQSYEQGELNYRP